MRLSDGTVIDDWLPKPVLPPPPPVPTAEELRLARIEAALAELGAVVAGLELSAPDVHVDAPDLSEIVHAVAGIKTSAPEAIAEALAPLLAPPEPPDLSVLAAVAEKLEQLDFRMRGSQPAFGASGPSNIADNESRKLGVVTSITDVVTTSVQSRETRFDYDGRTDSSPVYAGTAAPGSLTSDAAWKVQKFTYDGSGRATRVQVREAVAWDDRATGW